MGDRTPPAERALLAGEGADRDGLEETLSSDVAVDRAADFAGALDRLRTTTFACVILGDGDEDRPIADRVARLRRDGHDLPVVALVDDTLPETTDVAAVAPADDPAAAAARVAEAVADRRLDRRLAARRRLRDAVTEARAAALAAGSFDDAAVVACETLVAEGPYRVAWVGRHDVETERMTPVSAAGVPLEHLSSRTVDGERGGGRDGTRDGGGAGDVDGEVTAAALSTGAVASADVNGGGTVVAAPVESSPVGVVHAVRGDRAGVSEAERTALSSLSAALAGPFAGEGSPAAAPDAVRVLGDAFGHELGNQLDAATSHLELARERDDDSHYARVEAALDRMADLAAESRLLARGDVETERVDLGPAVRSAWEAVDAGDATLHVTDGPVEADPDLLGLLLENLLRNAVEHGGESVTVRTGPTDDGFAVADDGPGVPPDEREAVFDWGHSATGGGTGLGIVALVAERHGWSVEMRESQAGGARVEFSCS